MISVLYVDDDPVLLDIGKLYLEQSGTIRVDILESAATALDKIRTTRYDAVVSDFQMPEMDGIEFLKAVWAESPFLPFIIFSGKAREDIIIEALNNGADHYTQKGGDPRPQFTDLIHKIERSVERKQAQDTIIHLSRLNAVLSSTNRAVLRIRDRTALLNEACRIAVEEGRFLMAWIGMINPEEHSVSPVAACGYEDEYLSNISISVDNIPAGMGLTGTAIRERRSVISNDIKSDPRMAHYMSEATKRGYRSSACIPLYKNETIIGAMRFYSAEKKFFNEREIQLLEDLVDDIGFALQLADTNVPDPMDVREGRAQYSPQM